MGLGSIPSKLLVDVKYFQLIWQIYKVIIQGNLE